MSSVVVDASVVLAVLRGERGGHEAAQHLQDALISAVNLGEVTSVLADLGMKGDEIEMTMLDLRLNVVPFDRDQAMSVGELRRVTRDRGLSLGDRACLALAKQAGLPAMTADRAWANVSVGVEVRVIRE